jgi:hypothetical protein
MACQAALFLLFLQKPTLLFIYLLLLLLFGELFLSPATIWFQHDIPPVIQKPLSQTVFFSDDRTYRHSEVDSPVHTECAFFVEAAFTLFRVIQTGVYGVISCGLGLPAVVAVVALDKLHILPVMPVDGKVFSAGPAMKLRVAFHFTAHPAMGTDYLAFHSAASCLFAVYLFLHVLRHL